MSKIVSQKRWQYAQSSLIVFFFAKKSQKAIKNDLNHMTERQKCAIIIIGVAVRAGAFVFRIYEGEENAWNVQTGHAGVQHQDRLEHGFVSLWERCSDTSTGKTGQVGEPQKRPNLLLVHTHTKGG